jgi:2,4-dienoyl-CoA reductase-like NADH-dependent reductase (Old Yellow Enzyme family)
MPEKNAIDIIAQPLDLPCGLTLPNRLVKCPMQETLAQAPYFDPPIDTFKNLYTKWATSSYGLLITGQVQVDRRFLSIAGDVCTHERSLEPDVLDKWKQWAQIAQQDGTPCIVQLAHPGRMSPAGAGIRPRDMAALCPSSVPVVLGDTWLDKVAQDNLLGTPNAMTLQDIDEVVAMFVHAAIVAREAGFAGSQLHGAHGFLLSQFLSPHTNRRTDEYGGSAEKRLKLLQRLVLEIREVCPRPYCLSVKLNSADYMDKGAGLEQEEGLEQVRWLVECGMVDFVEISGGNAETKTSGLHTSFGKKTMDKAPTRSESTRIREGFFTDFAEQVQGLKSPIPIQLSGGFRSRTGMADAIDSGVCNLLLNPDYDDSLAFGMSHQVRGLWFGKMFPAKIIGGSFGIKFFYYNMRRLGHGMSSDPDASVPWIVGVGIWETLSSSVMQTVQQILATLATGGRVKTE